MVETGVSAERVTLWVKGPLCVSVSDAVLQQTQSDGRHEREAGQGDSDPPAAQLAGEHPEGQQPEA